MEFGSIAELISSVGFPIAMCVYLVWTNKQNNDKHAEEIEKLRQTVDNNTRAMIKLCAKMGVDANE